MNAFDHWLLLGGAEDRIQNLVCAQHPLHWVGPLSFECAHFHTRMLEALCHPGIRLPFPAVLTLLSTVYQWLGKNEKLTKKQFLGTVPCLRFLRFKSHWDEDPYLWVSWFLLIDGRKNQVPVSSTHLSSGN